MKTTNYKRFLRFLAVGCLGLSISLGASVCQAYFKGAPAYNANYRPIKAHMGVEVYVDLSSMYIVKDKGNLLRFNVLTAYCDEDADAVTMSSTPLRFLVNKSTREAWIWADRDKKWSYLNLNRVPYGYEESSFNAVNMCYAYLYGEFLNDSSGEAAEYGAYYKGK
jgi:hypothetical protein